MNKPTNEKKSLLFAIEDIAKMLRAEVKKSEPKQMKRTATHLKSAGSPHFVNAVKQIAKMLRTHVKKKPKNSFKKVVY